MLFVPSTQAKKNACDFQVCPDPEKIENHWTSRSNKITGYLQYNLKRSMQCCKYNG